MGEGILCALNFTPLYILNSKIVLTTDSYFQLLRVNFEAGNLFLFSLVFTKSSFAVRQQKIMLLNTSQYFEKLIQLVENWANSKISECIHLVRKHAAP